MLIPLGLGLKIYKFPVVTFLIILSNILLFSFEGTVTDLIDHNKLHEKNPFAKAEFDLFINFCTKKYTKDSCLIGEDFIHQKYSGVWPEDIKYYGYANSNQREIWEKFSLEIESENLNNIFEEQDFIQYQIYKNNFFKEMEELYLQNKILSKNTLSFDSLMINQFRHGSGFHLYSNLFFLLVFGIYAECALGSLFFLFTYLVGGSLGLFSHYLLFENNLNFIIGASANVSAMMGAFYVFFFHHYFKTLFYMGFAYKTFISPVKWTLPLFFFSNDIIGLLGLQGSGVSHIAHLGGLVAGMIIAYAISKLFLKINRPYLYNFEEIETEKIEKINFDNLGEANELTKLMKDCFKLTELNPLNYKIKILSFKLIENTKNNQDANLFNLQKKYLKEFYSSILVYHYKREDIVKAEDSLHQVYTRFCLFESINDLPLKINLFFLDQSLGKDKKDLSSFLWFLLIAQKIKSQEKLLKLFNQVEIYYKEFEFSNFDTLKIKNQIDKLKNENIKLLLFDLLNKEEINAQSA